MKEAYYFSHDSNTRGDEKIIALMMKHKWAGYGIFWGIIEKLRDSTNYTSVCDYNLIAYDLRVDASLIKSIIEDFGLFVFTDCGKYFYSNRLNKTMEFKETKSKKASENALKRWEKCESNTNAMQTQCDGNAKKVKESKIKEKGIDEIISTHPPEILEKYLKFNNWIKSKAPNILKIKNQISIENFIKLQNVYSDFKPVFETLLSIHNYKESTKRYVDVYLTLKKWLEKDGK